MKISLRPLKLKDAPLILEWMHDPDIAQQFLQDFSSYDLQSEEKFISESWTDQKNLHLAIISPEDEYLGGISLKNIDHQHKNAEYAIALRKKAIGKKIAIQATKKILNLAFKEKKLYRVYLNVLSENIRARKFYEKVGFIYEGENKNAVLIKNKLRNLSLYAIFNDSFYQRKPKPAKFKALEFPELGDNRGHLVVMESMKEIPFIIKRVFYIYGSDSKVIRGQHANKYTQFVLINVAGQSKVRVDDGENETIIELNHPHQGIYLNKMIWKDMYDFSPDSILLCLASEKYDDSEYIRNYQDYLDQLKK